MFGVLLKYYAIFSASEEYFSQYFDSLENIYA